jgi:predicted AlkP superfamily phosphohydrolase/phosphomutase
MARDNAPDIKDGITRRRALGLMGAAGAVGAMVGSGALVSGCSGLDESKPGEKVMILGFDGMDYFLTTEMMEAGELPNLKKLADKGSFRPLTSSNPPQSPVAWSNFITGKNPGGHGIYDFIARDPKTYFPKLSMSDVSPAKKNIDALGYRIPVVPGEVTLLRYGKSWWEILEENGIPASVLCIPSNFPPVECSQKTLSGMGTPDLLGTYGTYYYITTEDIDTEDMAAVEVVKAKLEDGAVKAKVVGPDSFKLDEKGEKTLPSGFDIEIYPDEVNNQALVRVGGQDYFMKVGEWSDWITISLEMVPWLLDVTGIVRLYLKSVKGNVALYVSPINIDPKAPALPISTPDDFSEEIAKDLGPYYTQGFPEDYAAYKNDSLGNDEFIAQVKIAENERIALYKYELERFKHAGRGVYFCYFGTTDIPAHMLWYHHDPKHPMHDPVVSPKYADALRSLYRDMDGLVGHAVENLGEDTTYIVMSDHGFSPFYRAFNVNSWLVEQEYMYLADIFKGYSDEFFENVDMEYSKAYAVGLNGLYINLKGREGLGFVEPEERDGLIVELIEKLKQVRDPKNGQLVFAGVYDSREIYKGEYADQAPDIILGYAYGYRVSDQTALGEAPEEIIEDNMDRWSGDHCMDPSVVPGILFTNRKTDNSEPALTDLAPTILAEFGIAAPGDMDGSNIF